MLLRLRPLLALIVALGVWALVARWMGSPLLIPSPGQVGATLIRLLGTGELIQHVAVSLQRLGVGLLGGVPIGVILGSGMGRWRFLDRFLDPFVRLGNSTPAIALIPFSLLWLGVTEAARYALLVYIIALTLTLNARHGVRQVPGLRLKAARSLGLGEVEIFFRVTIPSSFPSILAGVRTAIGLGVMVIVAAEMLGATSGLGYLIMEARQHYNVERMFVGIVGLGTLSLVLDRSVLLVIERYLPRWSAERRVR